MERENDSCDAGRGFGLEGREKIAGTGNGGNIEMETLLKTVGLRVIR